MRPWVFVFVLLGLMIPEVSQAQLGVPPNICLPGHVVLPSGGCGVEPESADPVLLIPGMTTSYSPSVILSGRDGGSDENWRFLLGAHLVYRGIIERMNQQALDVFVVHYDWTKPVQENARYLKDVINTAREQSGSLRVDIVAHSMGGLLAREYVQGDMYEHDVDQLITVSTPHKGSSDGYVAYEGGHFPTRWPYFLRKYVSIVDRARSVSSGVILEPPLSFRTHFPSLRDLVPTQDFLLADGNAISVDDMHPETQNLYLQYRNETLEEDLADTGVRLTTIASTSLPTVNHIPVEQGERSILDRFLARWRDGTSTVDPPEPDTTAGDQTVTLASALLDDSVPFEGVSHTDLPEKAQEQVIRLLTGEEPTGSHIAYDVPESGMTTLVLSPIMPRIKGPSGRVLAHDRNDFDESAEFIWDSENPNGPKLLSILDPEPGEYQYSFTGTGEGSYTIITSFADEDEAVLTSKSGEAVPGEVFTETISVEEETSSLVDDADYKEQLEQLALVAADGLEAGALHRREHRRIASSVRAAQRSLAAYERQGNREQSWRGWYHVRSYHRHLDYLERYLESLHRSGERALINDMQVILEKVQRYSPPEEPFSKRDYKRQRYWK